MMKQKIFKTALITTMLTISYAIFSTNAYAHANSALEEAIKNSTKEQVSYFRQMEVYAQLANHYKMIGNIEKSKVFFDKSIKSIDNIQEPYLKDEAQALFANELATAKEFAKSIEILNQINDQRVRTHATWKVSSKIAKEKNEKLAIELLEKLENEISLIKDLSLKAELLTGTGAKYRYIEPNKGIALVYEAYGIAQTFSNPFEKALMYNELGANLIDIGQKEKAMKLFKESKEIGLALKNIHQKADVFAMHGGELAEKGERNEAKNSLKIALQSAIQITSKENKDEVLSEIARNFGQSYAWEEGLKTCDMIESPYHKAEGYIRISKNMYKEKLNTKSQELLEHTFKLVDSIDNSYEKATILRKLAAEWYMHKNDNEVNKLLTQIEQIVIKI